MNELPRELQNGKAVRIWQAGHGDATRCTYFDRLSGPDPEQAHAPIDPLDMWWVAGPLAAPRRPGDANRPDTGDVVCGRHLEQAIYTYWQGWQEANMP